MSRTHRPRRAAALASAASALAAVAALTAAPAGAHVTVRPASAPQGGFEILSFSVPNESDTANTVTLEVDLPTKNPIASVSVQPMAGWTIAVQKTTLAKPVTTDDGQVTEAVSTITWTATAGGLAPGQFDLFTISAGPLPTKTKKLVFKVLQTYSDGEVARWIQPTVKGAPEPDFPAPVLTLTKPASGHH